MELEELYKEHYQIVTGIIAVILGLLFIAFKSYFSEKGKLKAQLSENKRLIEKTEEIKSRYNRELEELKKEHQLEISRRKYQYESKKEQYIQFFKLLDEFSNKGNKEIQVKVLDILDEFNKNYTNASYKNSKKGEANAATVMSKKIQKLVFDANQDLIRIKQETNTIRLVASEEVIDKLDLLIIAYDKSREISDKAIKELTVLTVSGDQIKLQINQQKIEVAGMVINNITGELKALMRKELNEI